MGQILRGIVSNNGAEGRFFVTPTALDKFRAWFPRLSDQEALDKLIDLSDDAKPKGETEGGLMRFRCAPPLRIYLLVAPPERGRTLPAIVDLAPPHEGWKPPGPHGGRRPGAGAPATGRKPELRKCVAQECFDWVHAQDDGYLERLIRADMDVKRKLLYDA